MSWQFQADQPIYTQLVARLQQQIVSGVYPPGSKLPSVRELAADAGVNPNTVQRAFAELLGIPKRSIENWESEVSKPPEYLVRLIRFYIEHQKN